MEDNYGVVININSIRQATCRTMKTKKTLGKREIKTMRKICSSKTMKIIECGDTKDDGIKGEED